MGNSLDDIYTQSSDSVKRKLEIGVREADVDFTYTHCTTFSLA